MANECDGVPTEFVDGCWVLPTHDSCPDAVVTFASEASPETGHQGWCWWALGRMGEALSYNEARAKAEAAVRRLKEHRTWVCSGCKRRVPWPNGCDDDAPDLCDECWGKKHGVKNG